MCKVVIERLRYASVRPFICRLCQCVRACMYVAVVFISQEQWHLLKKTFNCKMHVWSSRTFEPSWCNDVVRSIQFESCCCCCNLSFRNLFLGNCLSPPRPPSLALQSGYIRTYSTGLQLNRVYSGRLLLLIYLTMFSLRKPSPNNFGCSRRCCLFFSSSSSSSPVSLSMIQSPKDVRTCVRTTIGFIPS